MKRHHKVIGSKLKLLTLVTHMRAHFVVAIRCYLHNSTSLVGITKRSRDITVALPPPYIPVFTDVQRLTVALPLNIPVYTDTQLFQSHHQLQLVMAKYPENTCTKYNKLMQLTYNFFFNFFFTLSKIRSYNS